MADPNIPFTSQITDLVRDSQGRYQQFLFRRAFPTVSGPDVARYRFRSRSSRFLRTQVATRGNDLVDLAALRSQSGTSDILGWVYGGIAAKQANNGPSVASNEVFRILLQEK